MRGGERQQTVQHAIDHGCIQGVWKDERQQHGARRRPHRGKVAQIDGERAVADRIRRHKPMVEVDALDLRVGREHVERTALRLDHRPIVTRPDDHPRGHGQARGDARDELVLAKVGHRVHLRRSRRDHESAACG